MPGGDGTGPLGNGPLRGRGGCAGMARNGQALGFGQSTGLGFGRRGRQAMPPQGQEALQQRLAELEAQVEDATMRLKHLDPPVEKNT